MFITCFVISRSSLFLRRKWNYSYIAVQSLKGRGLVFLSHLNKNTTVKPRKLIKSTSRLSKIVEQLLNKRLKQSNSIQTAIMSKRTSSASQRTSASQNSSSQESFKNSGARPKSNIDKNFRSLPPANDNLVMQGQERGEGHWRAAESAKTPEKAHGKSKRNRNADQRPKSETKMFSPSSKSSKYKDKHKPKGTVAEGTNYQSMSREDIEAGMKSGRIIQGELRVVPRDFKKAYVSHPDHGSDVLIDGLDYRYPGLTGDVVAVEIFDNPDTQEPNLSDKKKNPAQSAEVKQLESRYAALDINTQKERASSQDKSPDRDSPDVIIEEDQTVILSPEAPQGSATPVSDRKKLQLEKDSRKGKVVAVIEQKHPRVCSGHIKPMKTKDGVLFSPVDNRLPRIRINLDSCPPDILTRPDDYANVLFAAKLTEWRCDSVFADGTLLRKIGNDRELKPKIEAILLENSVDTSEFTEKALDSLPIKNLPWKIPSTELTNRKDFRKQCVFSIDPATARDLDDALSIEELPDGTFDVGVHIADVSYFLEEETPLDAVAKRRATSVYLPHKVIPMLPRILCEELCSLNPDEDRLTFSVVWNISQEGEIYSEWFGRSVIRSCVKLSYDHAQGFIEEPLKEWTAEELPPISSKFTVEDIKKRVLGLNKIAVNLRKRRMDNGALTLNQIKMSFNLDDDTYLPNGFHVNELRDSNRLVEEFMLLANMAVAHKINKCLPETAMLRHHPEPDQSSAFELEKLSQRLGTPLDFTTAGSLKKSLDALRTEEPHGGGKLQVLIALTSKPMKMAMYFCNGSLTDELLYRHYALNVPLYTHFTSPIRRYPDVLVHRALSSALGYCKFKSTTNELQKIANGCNDRKKAAKAVSDASAEVFFSAFVQEAGPIEGEAMVMGILDHAVDVYFLTLGLAKRVYIDQLPLTEATYIKGEKLNLVWKKEDGMTKEIRQTLTFFTKVQCTISKGKLPLSWMAILKRPEEDSVMDE
ncbi:DIS3-like exonuclease 2 [Ylistrum balloti]|uniref:DIS3-like exonuclease 2 n=1 Tax=Ylistrum balloti TaxID=509963 RepID=UPI0029057F19|nr:DIS3-like exonuclease 2 [Ylistrum balloti]